MHNALLRDGKEKVGLYAPAIDFLVYSRARPGAPDADALTEDHWAYMDAFAAGMTARGPTFAADRETWTGSLHILDLPSLDAAHEFVEHEPYNRAGLFEAHLIRRFTNRLGRTMWDFAGAAGRPRFLVIAHGALAVDVPPESLIVHGELDPAGVALALEAPSRHAVETLFGGAEVHDWEFGGRR